ncbi:16S rRNA (adenine(1518)-N(6)/adenine(1519)-N(6))-dimethyltransferase RsmA [Rhodospirillum centenum]|uniref:Ribosomal RNA small subunit methyltransferase A n=1 Tax=Rhodospirillum centenum (strain ATCC 51521 / SW) TaxID=414684 RepID=B6IN67_RHOCS|nr:16S rRNA (adenine(1518)-N(6)/adenine(1519)-N(6))-dimethyltransferase RsmA [Rhodospirillum centenum]ACI98964.1 dimethyladenosine transferase [Rhodospirillum centenum SW]
MADLSHLPPLRDVIAEHGLGARKALGQHFLLDLNLTRRIVREAGDLSGVAVVEVGPGPGGLTRALVESAAREVVAVERDSRFAAALADVMAAADGRLRLVEADALTVDPVDLVPAPRAVISNLPYNVGTPLLIGWLKRIAEYRSLTLMFQKEVAERIVARPRTEAYGRLAVMCQWLADCRILFDVPARAFTPPPRVDSAIAHLTPRARPADDPDFRTMEALVAAAFGQRRKMLRASLKSVVREPEPLLESVGIAPTSRAEEVDVAGFVTLAKALRR